MQQNTRQRERQRAIAISIYYTNLVICKFAVEFFYDWIFFRCRIMRCGPCECSLLTKYDSAFRTQADEEMWIALSNARTHTHINKHKHMQAPYLLFMIIPFVYSTRQKFYFIHFQVPTTTRTRSILLSSYSSKLCKRELLIEIWFMVFDQAVFLFAFFFVYPSVL